MNGDERRARAERGRGWGARQRLLGSGLVVLVVGAAAATLGLTLATNANALQERTAH